MGTDNTEVHQVENNKDNNNGNGKVYLVGAGPGDSRLLTLRGQEVLQKAEVVLYDRLLDPSILPHIAPEAEKIYAGKSPGNKHYTQQKINQTLLKMAQKGRTVVRLKGGDAFVFGRGSEEVYFLGEQGIEVELVPGITSVIAAPEAAGIPLTHRGISSSFHVFSGHDPAQLELELLAGLPGTLVFLMGMRNIAKIIAGLKENGMPGSVPAAVIQQGTTAAQKTVKGRLDNIVELVREKGLSNPAVIVIGSVVEKGINSNKHQYNKRILFPRPRKSGQKLKALLTEAGIEVFHYPLLSFKGPILSTEIKQELQRIADYDWLMFSSSRGVTYFFRALQELGLDIRILAGVRIAVLGPAGARSLKKRNLNYDFMPEKYSGDSLVEEFSHRYSSSSMSKKSRSKKQTDNLKIMFPRSLRGRKEIPAFLRQQGFTVSEVGIYDTIFPKITEEQFLSHIQERKLDLLLFTSPSTVKSLARVVKPCYKYPGNIPAVCIGKVTASAAKNAGFNVIDTSQSPTTNKLFNKITNILQE